MKKVLFPILALVLALGLALPMAAVVGAAPDTDVYKSDTTDLIWSGATSADIDGSGYIVPPDGTWSNAVGAWVHGSWNGSLTPADRKDVLLTDTPTASWIWSTNPVTLGASYTGDILFVKKAFDIPNGAVNIQATLYITADNGYYFYVNDDWSGTPLGSDGFMAGYGPTDFYYTSDGSTNLGGGENSVGYETTGKLYPLDAGISTAAGPWQGIEMYDISSYVQGGSNELQIVAINEHAPPHAYDSNPGGLIYKLTVTYEEPSIEVEKDYRYTNVCFERDNDLDGQFNEDPVDFDPTSGLPIDNDGDLLFNEDDIDCPEGTSLGYLLPMDAEDNYQLEAVIHPKNGKVSSYNPGQYYAVSTVNVLDDVGTLTIMEDWDDCDEISTLNPKNGGGAVVIVQVGGEINGEPVPDPLAAYQIMDATSEDVTITGNTATAVLEDVKAGTTILMYVKFGPGLKGETWNPPNEHYGPCINYNRASVEYPVPEDLEDWITASANLIVVEKE